MSDEQQLQKFFSELKAKREAFAENYKYFAPQLAPQFTCFDFIYSDEKKLSEIIAHLLNPQATHAQNDLFLRLFFEEIEIEYPDCNQKIIAKCEAVTHSIQSSLRRIDILVDFGKDCFGLAIENKPWAADQNEQLSDYFKHLQNMYKDKYCLIYLSGDDSDPSKESIPSKEREKLEESQQYKAINYLVIVEWLFICERLSHSDNVKRFLRDFISYCQQQFFLGYCQTKYSQHMLKNITDVNIVEEFILKTEENLKLAFDLINKKNRIKNELVSVINEDSMLNLKKKLLNKFMQNIKNLNSQKWILYKAQKYFPIFIWYGFSEIPNTYFSVTISERKNPNKYSMYFEFRYKESMLDKLRKKDEEIYWEERGNTYEFTQSLGEEYEFLFNIKTGELFKQITSLIKIIEDIIEDEESSCTKNFDNPEENLKTTI